MPDLDLFDLGGVSSFIPAEAGFILTISIIFVIALLGAIYAFVCITRRNIGRKAGLKKDWMAFVPFARTVYLLQTVGEQWWKMFLLEYIWLYPYIISWFFNLFGNQTMTTFGNILAVLYIVAQISYKVYFRNKFCKAFNVKGEFSLATVTPWGFFFLRRVFECLIAYTNLVNYGKMQQSMSIGEVIRQEPMTYGQSPAPAVGSAPVRSAPPASGGSCSLTGMSGMYAGQELPMAPNDDMVIGRDSTFANIIIDQNADKVSRKHCVIRFDPLRNAYLVTDNSTNGTFIDGGNRLIANMPTPVQPGTIIALGSRENRFRLN